MPAAIHLISSHVDVCYVLLPSALTSCVSYHMLLRFSNLTTFDNGIAFHRTYISSATPPTTWPSLPPTLHQASSSKPSSSNRRTTTDYRGSNVSFNHHTSLPRPTLHRKPSLEPFQQSSHDISPLRDQLDPKSQYQIRTSTSKTNLQQTQHRPHRTFSQFKPRNTSSPQSQPSQLTTMPDSFSWT